MNLYKVTYKGSYNNDVMTCSIVSPSFTKAVEGAKAFIKKKHYGDREIVQTEKIQTIDRVQR